MRTLVSRSIAVPAVYAMLATLPLFFISLLAVRLQRDLEFGQSRLGLAIAIGFAASGVAASGAGDFVRSYGSSRGLRASALLAASALVLLAVVASSWVGVAVSLSLGGAANVVAQMSMNLALVPEVPPTRQALAFALKQTSMPAASLLCGLLVPVLAETVNWRTLALCFAAILLAAALVDPGLTSANAARSKSRRRPDRQLAAIAAAALCAGAVAAGLPAFAVDAAAGRGIAATTAGTFVAAGSLVALFTRVLGGWAVDRHRGHGLLEFAAIIGTGAGSFALLALADSPVLFGVGIVVSMGAAYGCAGVIHLATLRTSSLAPGRATAVLLTAFAVGNVAGPAGFGALVDHATYPTAWACASGIALCSTVAALLARRFARGTRPFAAGEF